MAENCDNKEQRQIYRFSLHPELHRDIIEMLEERTKSERPQLFIDAMRYFRKHCRYVEHVDGESGKVDPPPIKKTADMRDIFRFQES